MDDKNKTKEQLINELEESRRKISKLGDLAGEHEQTLWESEKRFRSIAESASDAIIIFDVRENIFYWNEAAQNIFGYWIEETRGHLLSSILSEHDREIFRKEIEQVVETGGSDLVGKTTEVIGVKKDGTKFPLELSLATWEGMDKVLFTAIGRDITKRKQAEEALQKAYEEVEKRVEERTAELQREVAEREHAQAESERLQQEVIEAQQRAIEELSTPVIPIMERIIVMPLIGSIDSMRAKDIMRALLAGIRKHRAKVVILDITGVAIVDTGVAAHLDKTIQAARLKGARTIVTGISDAVAETIVDLGLDWSSIETLSDLQAGLVVALNSLGFKLSK